MTRVRVKLDAHRGIPLPGGFGNMVSVDYLPSGSLPSLHDRLYAVIRLQTSGPPPTAGFFPKRWISVGSDEALPWLFFQECR